MSTELDFYMRDSERQFFDLLVKFTQSAQCPTTEHIRIAGGWVRDGLLKMPSNDLDVALADCTGLAFAKAFQQWLTRYTDMEQVQIVVVRANPEKSKHLETAIMDFPRFGLSVDFVNLRSETYASDSRIPSSMFGSPEDDAYRRDFTINALFYNVTTNEVEDFTEMGIADLHSMTLRTPMPPAKTFEDDPLRVIRAARFLAKFPKLKPDQELTNAASSAAVRVALETKVTRDRVRQELVKIFEYPEPLRALNFIGDCELMGSLLSLSDDFVKTASFHTSSLPTPSNRSVKELGHYWKASLTYLDATDKALKQLTHKDLPSDNIYWDKHLWNRSDNRGAYKFAALLARHHALRCRDGTGYRTAAEEALLNLKCQAMSKVVAKIQDLASEICRLDTEKPQLQAWARTFRLPGADRWWLLAALLASVVNKCSQNPQTPIDKILEHFRRMRWTAFEKLELENVPQLQPLFNGKDVKRLFPHLAGPKIGQVIEEQIDWQLQNWQPDIQVRLAQATALQNHLRQTFA